MSEHTPGPWRVRPIATIFTVGNPYGHGQMFIAEPRGWGHLTGSGACHFSEEKAIQIQEANAHLIAAAPDLLASVRELHKTLLDGMTADYDEMTAQLGRARAAIAKAEGQEVTR